LDHILEVGQPHDFSRVFWGEIWVIQKAVFLRQHPV
jgi:hypothetical protein